MLPSERMRKCNDTCWRHTVFFMPNCTLSGRLEIDDDFEVLIAGGAPFDRAAVMLPGFFEIGLAIAQNELGHVVVCGRLVREICQVLFQDFACVVEPILFHMQRGQE